MFGGDLRPAMSSKLQDRCSVAYFQFKMLLHSCITDVLNSILLSTCFL